jgi:hypothetical protein
MFRSKIITMIQVLCWLSALIGVRSSQAEAGRTSLLGMRLIEAEKTDFFSWFHLREIERQKDAQGQTTVIFKPEGESVRQFVTVKVVLKDQDKIIAIQLILSRSFVDDRRTNGVLARDISKSLLLAALPDADQRPIHDLVDAIESYTQNSDMIVLSKKPQKQPDLLTPGYQAYLGKQKIFTKELLSAVLIIENTEEGGAESLAIKVSVNV